MTHRTRLVQLFRKDWHIFGTLKIQKMCQSFRKKRGLKELEFYCASFDFSKKFVAPCPPTETPTHFESSKNSVIKNKSSSLGVENPKILGIQPNYIGFCKPRIILCIMLIRLNIEFHQKNIKLSYQDFKSIFIMMFYKLSDGAIRRNIKYEKWTIFLQSFFFYLINASFFVF